MQIPLNPLAPDMVLRERYKIISPLGQGGMSRVYLAMDLPLSVQVAVKENLQPDVQARTQFHREAEFLAHLSHPHLPRVTDYFDDPVTGRQYLVMDYIAGEDLGAMVQRVGPLPEDKAVQYIVQVLDALDYMHHQQVPIIHRDVKPSNIKITPQGKAVLVDFGIAKEYEATAMTLTGARAVTPGFAPPEQYGMHTDARSDVYAVGATLYMLVTGKVPPESTLRAANLATLEPPSALVPQISHRVDNAIQLAMEPDTKRRWHDAESFRAALLGTPPPPPAVGATVLAPGAAAATVRVSPAKTPAPASPPTMRAAPPPRSPNWLVLGLVAVAVLLLVGGGAFFLTRNAGNAASITPTLVAQPLVVPGAPSPTTRFTATAVAEVKVTETAEAPTARATVTADDGAVTALPTTQATSELLPTKVAATQAASTTAPVAVPSKPAIPAQTPIPAAAAATATPQGPAAVAVANLLFDPVEPHRNQRVRFNVTFQNTFPTSEQRTWSVWIYQKSNLRKTFWQSRPLSSNLDVGDAEVSTLPSDTWCVCGPGGPEDYIATLQLDGAPAAGVDGQPFTKSFTVNP